MKRDTKEWVWVLFFIVTFAFLQGFYAYHFFYLEQFQLFLTTTSYFVGCISQPGGMMEYVSRFFVQFFVWPYAGPAIVSFFLTLIFRISSGLFRYTDKQGSFFMASVSLFLSCLFPCLDFNYYFQGILSFLFCLGLLLVFLSMKTSARRDVLVFLSAPLLYWIAGSVSVLFAVCFTSAELFREGYRKRKLYWLLLPVWAFCISCLGVRYSFSSEFRMSFLPDMYYQPRLSPDASVYIPWIILIGWISILPFLRKIPKGHRRYFIPGLQALMVLFLVVWGIEKFGDRESYVLKKLDYYARNEQWDKIIHESQGEISNYLYLNYLNLALVQKGLLLEEMFNYHQHGILGLEVSSQDKRITAPLLSDIRFCIGDLASSRQYAFEGYESCPGGGSGRLMKRLIRTNIIYGDDAVAKKYIGILEHTWFYKEWASGQRRFLSNNSICREDEEIGGKRKLLPREGSSEFASDFPEILEQLYEIYPRNEQAENYLLAFYLLSRDIGSFTAFLNECRKEKIMTGPLPPSCQQALLVFYESRPDQWKKAGISEETIRQYNDYKSVLRRSSGNHEIREIMKKRFGSTYWFYFQFT